MENDRCLLTAIKECLIKEYYKIGDQKDYTGKRVFELYNCKKCGSTVDDDSIVSHYVNNHYSEGMKKLREDSDKWKES